MRTLFLLAGAGLATVLPVSAQPAATEPAPRVVTLEELERMKPAEDGLMEGAVALQKAGQPGPALLQFQEVLRYYPEGTRAEEALYHIAECYRNLGRFGEAEETLDLMGKKFPQGDWALPGALLRGEMLAADGKWKESLGPLQEAAALKQEALRLRALYLTVLARENLGQLPRARSELESLARVEEGNPYLDYARTKLGALLAGSGGGSKAAALFAAVIASSKDANLRAEAAVRAGNLAYAGGDWNEAVANYELVRRTDAPDFWKKLAHLGLVQAHFAAKDYEAVVRVVKEVKPAFPDSARAEVLFLEAEALRLSKNPKEALDKYNFIVKEFPKTPYAESALWARILLLQAAESEELLPETAHYLALYPESPRVYQVQMLRAEAFYNRREYAVAAGMLKELTANGPEFAKLSPAVRQGLRFRAGHAALLSGDAPGALASLAVLTGGKDGDVPAAMMAPALWMQGQADLQLKKEEAALAVWNRLVDGYPGFSQREEAVWKTALLAGRLKQYGRMQKLLGIYLKDYPESARRAEAWYWSALAFEELKQEPEAEAAWKQAREADAGRYYGEATRQLIRHALERKDTTTLKTEVNGYDAWRQGHPDAPAPSLDIYEWLGQELAAGSEPARAEDYYRIVLAGSKEREQIRRTRLALALLLTKLANHGAAIREWEAYRVNFPEEAGRSAVLEPLAKAYIGAARYDKAKELAERILRQNPEGEYNARGRLLLGEIAFAQRQYAAAAKQFSVVALLIDDPVLTPLALSREEEAYRRCGREKEADEALLRLKKEYPDYKPPAA